MTKTVLLIEDEPNIIVAISFILQRAGWRVKTHSDGSTAFDAVKRESPDVIVLDVMLPGRSGFDILTDVRADEAQGATPVLMLTAKGQTKDRERAKALGATQFMTKPFANQEVLAAVEALAEGAEP